MLTLLVAVPALVVVIASEVRRRSAREELRAIERHASIQACHEACKTLMEALKEVDHENAAWRQAAAIESLVRAKIRYHRLYPED